MHLKLHLARPHEFMEAWEEAHGLRSGTGGRKRRLRLDLSHLWLDNEPVYLHAKNIKRPRKKFIISQSELSNFLIFLEFLVII